MAQGVGVGGAVTIRRGMISRDWTQPPQRGHPGDRRTAKEPEAVFNYQSGADEALPFSETLIHMFRDKASRKPCQKPRLLR